MPTNLHLIEKANRAAELFSRAPKTSPTALIALPQRRQSTNSLSTQVHKPAAPHITFRFQPQFLDLAYQLLAPKQPGESFSLGICPALAEDSAGKFAAFFASSISEMAKAPVLLIETNFRRPCLARYLGARSTPGLKELLGYTGKTGLECIHATRFQNLHLLPVGALSHPKEPRNLKRGVERLYKLVSNEYQSIIIAYPAWNEVRGIHACYSLADAMLLAVRPGSLGAIALRRTVSHLRKQKAKLVGSVLSDLET